jgi:hypothetical protein
VCVYVREIIYIDMKRKRERERERARERERVGREGGRERERESERCSWTAGDLGGCKVLWGTHLPIFCPEGC